MSCVYFLGKKSCELYQELKDLYDNVIIVKVGQKLIITHTSILIGEYCDIDACDINNLLDNDVMKHLIYRVRRDDRDKALLFEDRNIIDIFDLLDHDPIDCPPLQRPSQPIDDNRMSFITIIIIIFIILLFAWAMLYIGPRG